MHQSLHRALEIVADRIGGLGRIDEEFARIGDELARDRVVRVVAFDQPGEGGGEGGGVARGDGRKRVRALARNEAGGAP
jgi:hypothetical protein